MNHLNQSKAWLGLIILLIALAITSLTALSIGRYEIEFTQIFAILLETLGGSEQTNSIEQQVVMEIRLPRILLAGLIGAGLALAGAALQNLLRNPLADPQILGVSSGAAFGGVLAIILIAEGWPFIVGAFVFGLLSLVLVFSLAGGFKAQNNNTLTLVLAGLVISALFSAGVSLIKFTADPQNELPAIVYWLLGSLAASNFERLSIAAPVIIVGMLILLVLRFHLSAMIIGAKEAEVLGVPVTKVRVLTLLAVGLIVAAAVAASGVIGWVGLVIPHLVRLALGANHRTFFFSVAALGATYLILVDTLARSITTAEVPLGALTALIGAPIFAYLLIKMRRTGHA